MPFTKDITFGLMFGLRITNYIYIIYSLYNFNSSIIFFCLWSWLLSYWSLSLNHQYFFIFSSIRPSYYLKYVSHPRKYCFWIILTITIYIKIIMASIYPFIFISSSFFKIKFIFKIYIFIIYDFSKTVEVFLSLQNSMWAGVVIILILL